MTPTVVSETDLKEIEKKWNVKFPILLKVFISTYCHIFDANICRQPLDKQLKSFELMYNPILIKAGYLPFAWDQEEYLIRCIDLRNMPDENNCAVYEIDHEILFDFEEDNIEQEDIDKNMKLLEGNFQKYLENVLLRR